MMIPPFRDPKHYRGLSDEDFDELWRPEERSRSRPLRFFAPPFHPWELVKNATPEQRKAMHAEWERKLIECNPRYFNADGTRKKWWQVLFGL
jgi:hypothetical protein